MSKSFSDYLWEFLEAVLVVFTVGIFAAIIWNRQQKQDKKGLGEIDGV